MDKSQFGDKSPGMVVPTEQRDGFAFVPHPLPPIFTFDYKLANAISEADVALAHLNGLARTPPHPEILARAFIRVEAVDSSKIEGTQTTYSELALFEAAQQAVEPDTIVVANYLTALNHGLALLKTIPLSRRLFCDVHRSLMLGYKEDRTRPGEIRNGQVVIGAPNSTPRQARFVPPPSAYLDDLITDLERFCNDYRELPFLLRVAMIHYQFETIHPF
jgi:Fic family protein